MSLVSLSDPIFCGALIGWNPPGVVSLTQTAMDAAGESTAFIGHIHWSDGGSHIVSSSASSIYWYAGDVGAFADGATTIDVGLQGVSGGIEDGTYTTKRTLTGGSSVITVGIMGTTMATGTKTLSEDDLVAVVITMTARGGADSVSPSRVASMGGGLPYCTTDTGSGPAKSSNTLPLCVIQADDGVFGILGPPLTIPSVSTLTSFNSGSTPDEYGIIFQVPFRCATNRLVTEIGELDTGETGTLTIYSDPLGTPFVERQVAPDPSNFGSIGGGAGYLEKAIPEFTFEPNTDYVLAYAATSTGSRLISRITNVPGSGVRAFTPFGTTLRGGTRSDGTGAFSSVTTTAWPRLGFYISKLDNGASAGGGLLRHAGMLGGLNA